MVGLELEWKIPSRNGWFGGTPFSGNQHIEYTCGKDYDGLLAIEVYNV